MAQNLGHRDRAQACSIDLGGRLAEPRGPGPDIEQTSSSFVDDEVQLLCQGLRGLVKLNEAACVKFDVGSFQVVTDRVAKLVGDPNSFPDQQRQHATPNLVQFP